LKNNLREGDKLGEGKIALRKGILENRIYFLKRGSD
jgi:hypothetical protein